MYFFLNGGGGSCPGSKKKTHLKTDYCTLESEGLEVPRAL